MGAHRARRGAPGEEQLHYHLLLIDEEGERPHCPYPFATQDEAENEARAVTFERAPSGWRPTRYPGRPWRPQEVVVFLDRRNPGRRPHPYLELTVVRCAVHGSERVPGCYLHGRRFEDE